MQAVLRLALVAFALLVPPNATSAKQGPGTIVTVLAADGDGPAFGAARDLAAVLDAEGELRILPAAGKGPVQSLTDLLHLKGIDAAILPSDTLAFAAREELLGSAIKRVRALAKAGSLDLHVLARAGVASIEDLRGKRIDTGGPLEARYVSAQLLFGILKIDFVDAAGEAPSAAERIAAGEIDAAVLMGPKPLPELAGLTPASGLTLLGVPGNPELAEIYAPQILTHEDYPGLIAEGAAADSLSASLVLAAFDWPERTDGFYKLRAVAKGLFDNAAIMASGRRASRWSNVNLAAEIPGWTRHKTADVQLSAPPPAPEAEDAWEAALRAEFDGFLAATGSAEPAGGEAGEELFARFLVWRKTNGRSQWQ